MVPIAAYRGGALAMAGGRRIAPLFRRMQPLKKYRGSLGLSLGGLRKRKRGRAKNSRVKARLRQRVGERIGTGTGKRNEDTTAGNLNSRTLYVQPLLDIPKGALIDQRERGLVNFRGMKFCHSLIMQDPGGFGNVTQKLWLNRCIISPKGCDTDPISTNFFRGNGTGRAQDFGAALSPIELHCTPINTDKYNVHMHRREKLGPYASTEGRNNTVKEWYTKLKRQIRYDDDGAVPIGKQMYYVWWYDFNTATAGSAAAVGFLNHKLHVTKYFKEPKN